MIGAPIDGHSNNRTAAIWLHNAVHTWKLQHSAPARGAVGPVEVMLPGFASGGAVSVSLVDTRTGEVTSTRSATAGPHGLALVFAPFTQDVVAIASSQ